MGNRASATEIDLGSVKGLQSLEGSSMILGAGPAQAPVTTMAPSAGASISSGMVAP